MSVKISPKARRLMVWLGVGSVIAALALMAGPSSSGRNKNKDETVKHVLTDFNTRELGVDSLASGIKLLHSREDALRREMAGLRKEMELLKKSAGLIAEGRDPALESRLKTADDLISELKLLRSMLPKNLRASKENLGSKTSDNAIDSSNTLNNLHSILENTNGNTNGGGTDYSANGLFKNGLSRNSLSQNGLFPNELGSNDKTQSAEQNAAGLNANAPRIHSIKAPKPVLKDINLRDGKADGKEEYLAKRQGQGQALSKGEREGASTRPKNTLRANPGLNKRNAFGTQDLAPDAKGLYLPSGSIISGYLVTGLDAPTSEKAKVEPFPVLISVDKSTLMPNNFRADLKECSILAAAYGDMSSERVYMRAESLSCITDSGKTFELELSGYAAGSDGKAGLRGRLVSRQGRLIARSLTAGFLEGLAGAFDVNPVPTINTTGSGRVEYDSVYNSRALYGAGAKGTGKALERIADFYMRLADNMFPVLEIDASRRVDLILTKGVNAPGLLHPSDLRYSMK